MTNLNPYQTLNLPEGASINDIKAAFRRLAKAHHPDAAGRTSGDVEKFIKAQTAYQKLLKKAVAHNRARRAEEAAPAGGQAEPKAAPRAAANWRLEATWEAGLDVHYRLSILRPAEGGCPVVLPWQAREACPRCLGQGRTLSRVGSLYRPCACTKCGGQGTVARESRLNVNLTPEMVGRGLIRLRQAGLYNAQEARRGDLILEITWVDHLPQAH